MAAALDSARRERASALRFLTLYGEPERRGTTGRPGCSPPGPGDVRSLQEVCRPGPRRPSETGDPDATGSATSGAARPCCWIPIPAAAADSRPPGWTTRSTCGPPASSGAGSISTWITTPNATSAATTTSRSTTRASRTRSSAGSKSAPSPSSRPSPASSPPPFRPTTSGSTPSSRSVRWAVPDPRGDPEGQPGSGADLHGGADHQPAAGPADSAIWISRSGRFFWVVDPDRSSGLPGARHPQSRWSRGPPGPATARQVRVYRFRPAASRNGADPNIGGITALARTLDPNQSYGPVRWELLIQGTDYYLDPLRPLARAGDQAGSERLPGGELCDGGRQNGRQLSRGGPSPAAGDSLRLIVQPKTGLRRRPSAMRCGRSTGWPAPIWIAARSRSICRSTAPSGRSRARPPISGSSVWRSPPIRTLFDRDNRLFPRARDPDAAQVLRESLHRLPPPHAVCRPDPADAGRAIRLALPHPAVSPAAAGTVGQVPDPPALQLDRRRRPVHPQPGRPPDPRGQRTAHRCGGRRLERGVDYTISYDLGQVTFLNPDALFGSGRRRSPPASRSRACSRSPRPRSSGFRPRYSPGRAGRDQPHRHVPAGAERLQPAAARLRGLGQPGRRHQHRAALQAEAMTRLLTA